MNKPFRILVIAFFVTACTKKATIKLPAPETKLVATCFITPEDSIISAVVRSSTPQFGPQDSTAVYKDDISNAVVKISDGTTSVTLPFDNDLFFYKVSTINFPIVPGRTYYFDVSTPDGKTM